MGNLRVENCCCFSLETGVIILGAFDLIVGILTIGNGGLVVGQDYIGVDYILEGLVLAICGLLCILGVRKSNPNYFIPFLFFAGLGVIRYFITFIVDIYQGIKNNIETGQLVFNACADLVIVGLALYFWAVVWSLFKSLKEGSSNRNNSNIA